MDSFRLLSQGLIFKVLLGQPLYVLPHIWVVFQIFIERPDDVQPPVVLRLDQASYNLKAPLFQGIHCKDRIGKQVLRGGLRHMMSQTLPTNNYIYLVSRTLG